MEKYSARSRYIVISTKGDSRRQGKNPGLEDDELMIAAGPMWAGIAENRDKLTKCIKTAQLAQNDLGSTNISPHTQFHPSWMKNIVVKEIFY